jgi:hypothetical protein
MKKINFLVFKYKFLFRYIIFGFLSLLTELIFTKFFIFYQIPFLISILLAFLIGIFLAFYLNVRYNFHITKAKRKRALIYFTIISTFSFSLQLILRKKIEHYGLDMDTSHIAIYFFRFIFFNLLYFTY